jgi:glucose-6-phosphate isomerase
MQNNPSETKEWAALRRHAAAMMDVHMQDLFANDAQRFKKLHLSVDGLTFDFSRHRAVEETLTLLAALAKAARVEEWREKMFQGQKVNTSEKRAALHTALRGSCDTSLSVDNENVSDFVEKTFARIRETSEKIRADKKITDIVNIGIGGSDLGTRVVYEALEDFRSGPRVHFISNVDGSHISSVLKNLQPDNTVFIVASKTFSTLETMANARVAKDWAGSAKNFYAVTCNESAAKDFGVAGDHFFPMRDWVGGRLSLWSAVGLPVAIAVGFENFKRLLEGARAMDRHFREAPLEKNIPVLMGMLGIWYRNFLNFPAHVLLPYTQSLRKFPAYLQQLDMESNGKSVDRDNRHIDYKTGPLLFGETGTNAQHAFMQLMHQGTDIIPADFIIVKKANHTLDDHHRKLNANALAQAQALMQGSRTKQAGDIPPARVFDGNRPSSTLILERLDPWHLGLLLALYEHKVFVQGIVWNINSFDQWGVELGKILASNILDPEANSSADQTTYALMQILGNFN